MRRRPPKPNLKLVFMYYILMLEITVTGLCYVQKEWLGFWICGIVSFIIWRLIKSAKKKLGIKKVL